MAAQALLAEEQRKELNFDDASTDAGSELSELPGAKKIRRKGKSHWRWNTKDFGIQKNNWFSINHHWGFSNLFLLSNYHV